MCVCEGGQEVEVVCVREGRRRMVCVREGRR